jgi:hypothetical protein
MNELTLFRVALVGMFACAAVTAVALLKITAPYGRHVRRGFGATMSSTGARGSARWWGSCGRRAAWLSRDS